MGWRGGTQGDANCGKERRGLEERILKIKKPAGDGISCRVRGEDKEVFYPSSKLKKRRKRTHGQKTEQFQARKG